MTESLIDTDILSFYFRGDKKVVDKFKIYLSHFDQINISIITYYEVLAGLNFRGAERQLQQFQEFVDSHVLLHLSEASARIAADLYATLRKSGITIGASDLFIAGIAIENSLTLITNNEKHYGAINKLRVENWTR